jgi:hypothetical protein
MIPGHTVVTPTCPASSIFSTSLKPNTHVSMPHAAMVGDG